MRNRLKPQDSKGTPAMAGLLLLVLVVTSMTGCLFPQDEQVIDGLPPKRNSPVKVVSQEPQAIRTTFFNSTLCQDRNPSFTLTVEDDDLSDQIRSIWFVGDSTTQDFRPNNVTTGTQRRLVTAPNSGSFKTALANLPAGTPTQPRSTVLTVYVADTDFLEVVGGQISLQPRAARVLPDGSSAVDRGSFDSHSWTLDVEPCSP